MKSKLVIAAALAGTAFILLRNKANGTSIMRDIITAGNYTMKNGTDMKTSQIGVDKLKAREGFSAKPYKDANGFSIGFGHFILPADGAQYNAGISQSVAEQLLKQDLAKAEHAVNAYVKTALTQFEFDALVSFTYNVGVGGLAASQVLRDINAGNKNIAASKFSRFVTVNKVVNVSLVKRRESERLQFLGA